MNRDQILAVLYDLAMVIGGEIRLRPLLARTLQRLLFHTSFPCGMVFLGPIPQGPAGDPEETHAARLELSIGDFELAGRSGTTQPVPAALLRGGAELREDPGLLDRLPCRQGRYRAFLRLPVGESGVIVLLSPALPEAPDVPLTRIFQPVLANLAKSIQLCQAAEAYTRGIEADVRQLAAIVESSDDAIVGKSLDGTIVSWNRGAERIYGYTAEEVKGRPVSLLVPVGAPDDVGEITRRVQRGEHVEHYETLRQRKDGHTLYVSLTVSPVRDEAGRIVGASVITRDITDRKEAEEALRRASVYNRSLIEASLDPLVTIGPGGKITDVNAATEAVTGRSRMELIGTDFSDYFSDPERARAGYQQVFREGSVRDYELEIRRRDGGLTAVLYNASLYRDESGAAAGVFAAARDITARKRAEDDLRKLNRALLTLSTCNMALVHARDEGQLIEQTCRAVVEVGGFPMAWVGYAEDDPGRSLRPVTRAGRADGYLEAARLTWAPGCGAPAGAAARTGEPLIFQDLAALPGDEPWLREARQRGYAAVIALPLRFDREVVGALEIFADQPQAFSEAEVRQLAELAADLSYGIRTLRTRAERDRALVERQSYLEQLRKVMEDTVQAIAAILEMRDPYTAGHQRRVAQLAGAISRELGLPPDTVDGVRFGALIHDIGKIYVPAEFLSRPGRLLDLEFALIKTHPQVGYDLVKEIEFPWPVARMIHQHHEHLDGSGYPLGLKGDEIAFEARIVTVADVVEAMASHRPYRPARGVEKALEEVLQHRGVLYDAAVVDACLRLFHERGFDFQ